MPSWKLEGKTFEKKLGKMLLLGVVITIGLILCLSNADDVYYFGLNEYESDKNIELADHLRVLASDEPITINGDDDLADQFPSYIIENRIIDATGPLQHAINISNTQDPFEIRNCIITGVTGVSACLLRTVSNCTLTNVSIISNDQIGLELY
ncbi:MAG: hypothetical protein ACFFCX_18015, partial [Candidatus Sifarchaeia archaeon]